MFGNIHVKFLDGSPDVWDRVAKVVARPGGWNSVCGAQFIFEQDPNSRVLVTFGGKGTDYRDGLVRLGGMDDATQQFVLARSVHHIFGHVLGLHHQWGGQIARQPFSRKKAELVFGEETDELLGNFCHNTFPSHHAACGEGTIMDYLCSPTILKNFQYLEGAAHHITPRDVEMAVALHGPLNYDWVTDPLPSMWE